MTAYILHKDTALILANFQKQFISEYNKQKMPSEYMLPKYPLFAFLEEKDSINNKIKNCTILFPQAESKEVFFPFMIEYQDGTKEALKIIFATSKEEIKKTPDIKSDVFPMPIHIFRKADAILENNSWQIFNDKWYKIK